MIHTCSSQKPKGILNALSLICHKPHRQVSTRSCWFYRLNSSRISSFLSSPAEAILVRAHIISCMDYWNRLNQFPCFLSPRHTAAKAHNSHSETLLTTLSSNLTTSVICLKPFRGIPSFDKASHDPAPYHLYRCLLFPSPSPLAIQLFFVL